MKTREQVEDLKQQWLADGCWDIEDTEGYEEYKDELRQFSLETERKVKERILDQELKQAEALGLVNLSLTRYLMRLEERIINLEKAN